MAIASDRVVTTLSECTERTKPENRPWRLSREEDCAQRGQRHHYRGRLPVPRVRHRIDAAHVSVAAPPVDRGIAVEDLPPVAALRHADAVLVARDRRAVERH